MTYQRLQSALTTDSGNIGPRYLYITRVEHPNEAIYTENLSDFFAELAVPTREIVMQARGADRTELAACLAGDARAVLGFNWHLDHSCIGDEHFLHIAAAAGVPVIQWLVDHPSSIWHRFEHTSAENSCFLFNSGYSEAYFRQFVMPDCRSALMAGNTGTSRHSRIADLTPQGFLARDIKCLLPLNLRRLGGTIEDLDLEITHLPPRLEQAVRAAIAHAHDDLDHPIEWHFFNNSPPMDLLQISDLFHQCIRIIEDIVQVRRRLAVLSVAREFPVLIQSDLAANYLPSVGAAVLESAPTMRETLTRIPRARAIVSLTHVNDEIHNRTLNALNAGAVNIIEDNVVHRRFFTHGKNALLFRYGDDSLRECLDIVCSRPERAYEIAAAGFAMRDDPRLRFAGFHNLLELARA